MHVVTNKENTSAETEIKICEMRSNPPGRSSICVRPTPGQLHFY